MTYSQWLLLATRRLQPHEEARLLARRLLDDAAGHSHAHLLAPDEELSPEVAAQLEEQLTRLEAGEPLPYVLGHAPFWGREWRVEAGVLIPRPETELLVAAALEHLPMEARVAELGTGSGIVAGTLALERPRWQVWASELSPVAGRVARANWEELGARVELLVGAADDWLGPIRQFAPLDCIVSNPPYIPSGEIDGLQTSVREFEPRMALDGGPDGLTPYHQIAAERELLAAGGFVALEAGHDQRAALEEMFADWARQEWKFDLQGVARTLLAWK